MLRSNYRESGISFYFFTDDNFARKRLWRETFEAIIRLRNEENIKVTFMMQVDLAKKPQDFVRLAAEAGCTQVFIGMESVNPANLKAEGKAQNHVEEYQSIIKEWHDAGVVVHTGYIIGLPFDTKDQVPQDVRYLMEVIQPDQASFFMMTPLPGSHDHREMKKRGEWMDPDFNKRDSFHATTRHPHMTAEEWTEAYENAWKTFYSKENMIRILSRWNHNPKVYWNLISVYFWYKNAALIEKEHPMIAGFFRLKSRRSRRPGFAIDPLPVHFWKRSKEIARLVKSWGGFLKEMEEVWLRTRKKTDREERWLGEIQNLQSEIWQALKIPEWQRIYGNAKSSLPLRVKTLLDPLEELSSKILLTRGDLKRFLKQWDSLPERIHELRRLLNQEGEAVWNGLEEVHNLLKRVRSEDRIRHWQDAYSSTRRAVLLKLRWTQLKFDASTNRVVDSREDLERFWAKTMENLRRFKFWQISPVGLVAALARDVVLTTSFALTLRAASKRD
jgi:hypothetical protein